MIRRFCLLAIVVVSLGGCHGRRWGEPQEPAKDAKTEDAAKHAEVPATVPSVAPATGDQEIPASSQK